MEQFKTTIEMQSNEYSSNTRYFSTW